ncbi:hypothetical protein B484DRAFT_421763 [Ochromonadaceae sp. CCMP2298]|nr:hypothetical protein B484DRAFT_421763 [Ochromonadaceae sp. CCMP2298]
MERGELLGADLRAALGPDIYLPHLFSRDLLVMYRRRSVVLTHQAILAGLWQKVRSAVEKVAAAQQKKADAVEEKATKKRKKEAGENAGSMAAVKAVVLELGGMYARGGVAGEPAPRFTLEHGLREDDVNLKVRLCELFKHIFVDILHLKSKQCSVLLVEKLLVSRNLRDHVLSVLLKEFHVQSVSVQPDLLMGMVASGCADGVVLNVGAKECQSICFAEGRPLMHTLKVSSVGVDVAIAIFKDLLQSRVSHGITDEASSSIFHRVACAGGQGAQTLYPAEGVYESGDSSEIVISAKDRQSCLTILLMGLREDGDYLDEAGGAVGILLDSLKSCNNDVRKSAAQHIIIMGGGAMIKGLPEAICETASMLASSDEYKSSLGSVIGKLQQGVLLPLPCAFARSFLAWVGGSLFARLKSSRETYMSLQALEEQARTYALTETEPGQDQSPSFQEQYLLSSPDWLSLDNAERRFCSISLYTAHLQNTITAPK